MADPADGTDLDEILFEFVQIGGAIKVTAVHAKTGTEASIVGDPRAAQTVLEQHAVRKLRYVMAKTAAPSST